MLEPNNKFKGGNYGQSLPSKYEWNRSKPWQYQCSKWSKLPEAAPSNLSTLGGVFGPKHVSTVNRMQGIMPTPSGILPTPRPLPMQPGFLPIHGVIPKPAMLIRGLMDTPVPSILPTPVPSLMSTSVPRPAVPSLMSTTPVLPTRFSANENNKETSKSKVSQSSSPEFISLNLQTPATKNTGRYFS